MSIVGVTMCETQQSIVPFIYPALSPAGGAMLKMVQKSQGIAKCCIKQVVHVVAENDESAAPFLPHQLPPHPPIHIRAWYF